MPRKYDKSISDSQLEGLAAIGLTTKELADLLGVDSRWFDASKQYILDKGRSRLRQSLRRQQIKTALSGNATMQIWLGKQYLSQTENASLTVQAAASSLLVTPTVLEQLQQSYTLTLEEIRTTKAIGVSGGKAGGTPVDPHPLPKTTHLSDSEDLRDVDSGDTHLYNSIGNETVEAGDDEVETEGAEDMEGDGDGGVDAGVANNLAGADGVVDDGAGDFEVEDYVPMSGFGRPKGSLTRKNAKGIPGPGRKGKKGK